MDQMRLDLIDKCLRKAELLVLCVCRVSGNWSELPFETTEEEHKFICCWIKIICLYITTLSMAGDATTCDHADTHVDTLVSLVWLRAGSYLRTWE